MSEVSNSVYQILPKDEHLLAKAFLANHFNVVEINLQTGQALIIKHQLNPDLEGRYLSWSDFIMDCAKKYIHPMDQEQVFSLTLERLRRYCAGGKDDFPIEVRCYQNSGEIQWMSLSVTCAGSDDDTAIFSARNVNETILIRKIVDLFVYQNYDYLYLINAKKDSYIRFTGSKEHTPLPPEKGEHYTEDMIAYNRRYVALEDYERVTASMQIPHIVKMLERSDIYSFTSGGITIEGNYRRSRVVFLYYDKTEELILMARTDVTQIYLEEQEKNRQLAEALRSAQHDPMTGIYNQKATGELIAQSLQSQYHTLAALFFIDVDNFKKVNDTYGHQKGNEYLCFLAKSIADIAGREGIAGRVGGDEYLLYTPSLSSVQEIENTARQICTVFKSIPCLPETSDLSCSVGIAVYPFDGTEYGTLLCKADEALYTAKRYGKKQYYFYSDEAKR